MGIYIYIYIYIYALLGKITEIVSANTNGMYGNHCVEIMNHVKIIFLYLLLIRVNATSSVRIFQFRDWSMGSMTRDRFVTSVLLERCEFSAFHTPTTSKPGQGPLVHIKLDGLLSWPGRFDEETTRSPCMDSNPGHVACGSFSVVCASKACTG